MTLEERVVTPDSWGGLGTREQVRHFAHGAWTFNDNGLLCLGHMVDVVPKLQPMLDPQVRSVTCLAILAATLLVGAWALAIRYQMFTNNLTSYCYVGQYGTTDLFSLS